MHGPSCFHGSFITQCWPLELARVTANRQVLSGRAVNKMKTLQKTIFHLQSSPAGREGTPGTEDRKRRHRPLSSSLLPPRPGYQLYVLKRRESFQLGEVCLRKPSRNHVVHALVHVSLAQSRDRGSESRSQRRSQSRDLSQREAGGYSRLVEWQCALWKIKMSLSYQFLCAVFI